MDDTAVIDEPQVGATAEAQAQEAPIINRPADTQEQPPPRKEPAAPPLSLADSIRAKFKANQKPEEKKPEEKNGKPDDKPKKAEPEKPKAKGKAKPEPEQRPAVDPMKIAEAQGREMGDRILSGMKKSESAQQPAEPNDAEIAKTLPDEYRADADVYVEMKRLFPEKHGRLLTALKEAAEKEMKYIDAWERQHPDEEYNPDDAAHNAFYKKNFPEIPDRDFEAAKTSLNDARIEAKIDSKYRTEIEQLKRDKAADRLAPVIHQRVGDVIESALGAIDENLIAIARDPEKLNALSESNPIAADVVMAVHQTWSPIMAANVGIHQGAEKFDPQNGAHKRLFDLALETEQEMARLPIDNRIDKQGRMFATRAKYNQMTAEEQAEHWYVDQDVLAYRIAQKSAHDSKKWFDLAHEKHKKWAKANGIDLSSATKTTQTATAETAQTTEEAPAPAEETHSGTPSPGRGQLPSPWTPADSGPKTGREMFLKRLRGG